MTPSASDDGPAWLLEFRSQVRARLKAQRSTQAALAAYLGISAKHMNQVLKGGVSPNPALLDKIATAVGLRIVVAADGDPVPLALNMAGRRRAATLFRLCGGDLTSGKRGDCPDGLHDFPLPDGYVDASEAAERRMRHGWGTAQCPDCGLWGWLPGRPTGDPCDERVPVAKPPLG